MRAGPLGGIRPEPGLGESRMMPNKMMEGKVVFASPSVREDLFVRGRARFVYRVPAGQVVRPELSHGANYGAARVTVVPGHRGCSFHHNCGCQRGAGVEIGDIIHVYHRHLGPARRAIRRFVEDAVIDRVTFQSRMRQMVRPGD